MDTSSDLLTMWKVRSRALSGNAKEGADGRPGPGPGAKRDDAQEEVFSDLKLNTVGTGPNETRRAALRHCVSQPVGYEGMIFP